MNVTQDDAPWTADPWLRWDDGQRAAVGAAIGVLSDIVDGDNLDPAYWRGRVTVALEMLGAAVST